jgi:hypothetical protein
VDRRLEAGWGQRIAWSVLVIVSLGFLSWVPFLYVGIRRKRSNDWIRLAAFAAATVVLAVWASLRAGDPGDPILGAYVTIVVVTAVVLLLFTVFDKGGAKFDAVNVAQPEGRQFLQ